ncbi:LPXTG cell wall anchor domain-containing protein [Lactobacillus kitasatonis]|uniref:LPXTG cell wall anchor domain-containing protein n=1 Tax=Lactobacillus kitasatonis TaxID=237446 RepID=UPI001F331261|nr:LPXTG cell wall anchor domain-containing protein [Lactobacillus kitasatonis]
MEIESNTTRHADEATLPKTGEEQSELAMIFSMHAAALGITGLAGTSKRREKDK